MPSAPQPELLIPRFFSLTSDPVQVVVPASCTAHAVEHFHALIQQAAILSWRTLVLRGRQLRVLHRWRGIQRLRRVLLLARLGYLVCPRDIDGHSFTALHGPAARMARLCRLVLSALWRSAQVNDRGAGPAWVGQGRRGVHSATALARLLRVGVAAAIDLRPGIGGQQNKKDGERDL